MSAGLWVTLMGMDITAGCVSTEELEAINASTESINLDESNYRSVTAYVDVNRLLDLIVQDTQKHKPDIEWWAGVYKQAIDKIKAKNYAAADAILADALKKKIEAEFAAARSQVFE